MSIHEKKHAGLVEGKVVLVTGAGAGLGRATALLLAEEGAKVVVTDWAQQDGMDTLKVIKDAGGEAAFVLMDISKEEDIKAGIQFAIDTYGRLDCAVNNAAMEQERAVPMDEFSDEEWDRLMLVNLKGCFWCVKHEANAMLKNGGGSIVNISSIDGFKTPGPGYGLYDTAKAGVIHMTKAAAKDYGKTANGTIRVNCISPGVFMTPMVQRVIDKSPNLIDALNAATPMGRVGEPIELANFCVWLCSDRSSYMTGHNLVVDGGTTI